MIRYLAGVECCGERSRYLCHCNFLFRICNTGCLLILRPSSQPPSRHQGNDCGIRSWGRGRCSDISCDLQEPEPCFARNVTDYRVFLCLGVNVDTASPLAALCAVQAVARHLAALRNDSGPFQLKQAPNRARGDRVSHYDCPNTSSACTMTSVETLAPEAATGPLVHIHMPGALR